MLELDEARTMVLDILATDPDARFGVPGGRQNMYFYASGKPACLVGHVFHRIGIKRDDLILDPKTAGALNTANETFMYAIWPTYDGKIADDAAEFLEIVQRYQDRGMRWGEIRTKLLEAPDGEADTQAV